jgi:hypothetical protein
VMHADVMRSFAQRQEGQALDGGALGLLICCWVLRAGAVQVRAADRGVLLGVGEWSGGDRGVV